MKFFNLITILSSAATVATHATTTGIFLDGVHYRGFDARVDPSFPGLKSPEWTFTNPPFMGMGPVLDLNAKDIACQKDSKPPNMKAFARAGAEVTFEWTPYYQQHKGPITTWMGRLETPDQPITQVKFFKIDEYTKTPGSIKWASDKLIAQNYTWTSRIPSDIKAGTYVLRHELLALHDAKQQYNGMYQSGAQFYPVCYNVEVIGSGTATPEGKTFPGMYSVNDPGIKTNLAEVINGKYVAPGLPKYAGQYASPTGPKPVVTETGEIPASIRPDYNKRKAIVSFISSWTVEGGDYYVPGEGEKPSATFDPKTNWSKLYQGLSAILAKPASDFA